MKLCEWMCVGYIQIPRHFIEDIWLSKFFFWMTGARLQLICFAFIVYVYNNYLYVKTETIKCSSIWLKLIQYTF